MATKLFSGLDPYDRICRLEALVTEQAHLIAQVTGILRDNSQYLATLSNDYVALARLVSELEQQVNNATGTQGEQA